MPRHTQLSRSLDLLQTGETLATDVPITKHNLQKDANWVTGTIPARTANLRKVMYLVKATTQTKAAKLEKEMKVGKIMIP